MITSITKTVKLMNKELKLSASTLSTFNNACEQVVQEFSEMRDGSNVFDHEVKFGDGKVMAIQVITCRDDTCYTQGVLFDEGHELACTDPQYALTGDFTVGDYTVKVIELRA